MNLVAVDQLDAVKIARAQVQIAIAVPSPPRPAGQSCPPSTRRSAWRNSLLFGSFTSKAFTTIKFAVRKLRRQRRAQRAQQLLAGKA